MFDMKSLGAMVTKFFSEAARNADPELSIKFARPGQPLALSVDAQGKTRTNLSLLVNLSVDAPGDSDRMLVSAGNALAQGNFSRGSGSQTEPSTEQSQPSSPSNP
jgi:hypothetical protein